ncbi:ABC transporter permease, partial [Desulfovibrio sp. OttesenSCG-928-O18]|nr:ABC transporter permease [Desulfovibrio sp. OttesenSCG-928-O18]
MGTTASDFTWKFHRLGGLDQVTLRTAEELTHLHDLNPKLWAALSCPASGLEFDQRALALIDTDNDGRIRVPEVLEAVSWLNARLANPADMVDAPEELPLERIATETPEGRHLLDTAKSVLENLGKTDATAITCQDVAEALAHASQNTFNGDGVIPALAEFGPDVTAFVTDALAVVGGVQDASGVPGINAEIANVFIETLRA